HPPFRAGRLDRGGGPCYPHARRPRPTPPGAPGTATMTTPPAPRFGALLKHHRRAAGLTQEALAEQARLSVRGIQNLESGVSQTPRPDTVALLATALGLAPEERAELLAAARRPPRRALPPAPSAVGPTV